MSIQYPLAVASDTSPAFSGRVQDYLHTADVRLMDYFIKRGWVFSAHKNSVQYEHELDKVERPTGPGAMSVSLSGGAKAVRFYEYATNPSHGTSFDQRGLVIATTLQPGKLPHELGHAFDRENGLPSGDAVFVSACADELADMLEYERDYYSHTLFTPGMPPEWQRRELFAELFREIHDHQGLPPDYHDMVNQKRQTAADAGRMLADDPLPLLCQLMPRAAQFVLDKMQIAGLVPGPTQPANGHGLDQPRIDRLTKK